MSGRDPAPVACLPMYDLPALASHTDRLWAALREALRARGIAAPQALERTLDHHAAWLHPRLVLGQTCGLPYVRELRDRVALVGALDYGVAGCPPGRYCSVLVVREADARADLAAFRGAAVALNARGSQSGYGALIAAVAPLARGREFFARALETGSHRAAMRAVLAGSADLAAVDAVTWRLARAACPELAELRQLARTEPMPGLPLITAKGAPLEQIRDAVEEGLRRLDDHTRAALGVRALVRFTPGDYAVIEQRLAAAEAAVALPPPEHLASG